MTVLGVTCAALALIVVGMAIRMSGLKADAVDADRKREEAERALELISDELSKYRQQTEEQLQALRDDIQDLENELEECDTPGTRRARLERLLSKATDRSG